MSDQLPQNPFQQEPQVEQTQQKTQTQQQYYSQVPVELVTLPSKGAVYPVGHPLCNEQAVEIRCMSGRDEDVLSSKALIKNGTVISQLLKNCIMNKLINPDQMLTGDRNAILIGLRVTGYGSEYHVKVSCPECEKDFENAFSLGNLTLKPLTAAPLQPNMNLFSFILPSSNAEVHFRLLTGEDEQEIGKILEGKRKLGGQIESAVTTRLVSSIISINGETDRQKINQYVLNMRAGDARAFRKYIDDIEPGVDMTQPITCPHCDAQSEVTMPLGMTFFWPDAGR
jgi:hypothetical protein